MKEIYELVGLVTIFHLRLTYENKQKTRKVRIFCCCKSWHFKHRQKSSKVTRSANQHDLRNWPNFATFWTLIDQLPIK